MSSLTLSAARKRFDLIRGAYVKVQARKSQFRLDMFRRYSNHDAPSSWRTRRENVRWDAIIVADGKVGERMCALLDEISPRDWRSGVPAHWLVTDLTFEDATTRGALSVVPPCAYGMRPSDMERFAAQTFPEPTAPGPNETQPYDSPVSAEDAGHDALGADTGDVEKAADLRYVAARIRLTSVGGHSRARRLQDLAQRCDDRALELESTDPANAAPVVDQGGRHRQDGYACEECGYSAFHYSHEFRDGAAGDLTRLCADCGHIDTATAEEFRSLRLATAADRTWRSVHIDGRESPYAIAYRLIRETGDRPEIHYGRETLAEMLSVADMHLDTPAYSASPLLGAWRSELSAAIDRIDDTGAFLVLDSADDDPADFTSYAAAVAHAHSLADEAETAGYETDRSWASQDNLFAVVANLIDHVHATRGAQVRTIQVVRDSDDDGGDDHCDNCGSPDDGTQSYCHCGEPLIDPKHISADVTAPSADPAPFGRGRYFIGARPTFNPHAGTWKDTYAITEIVDITAAGSGGVIGSRHETIVETLPDLETAERYAAALDNGATIAPDGSIVEAPAPLRAGDLVLARVTRDYPAGYAWGADDPTAVEISAEVVGVEGDYGIAWAAIKLDDDRDRDAFPSDYVHIPIDRLSRKSAPADDPSTWGKSIDPYARGTLTARTRSLLAGNITMYRHCAERGEVDGSIHLDDAPSWRDAYVRELRKMSDTGKVHGPEVDPRTFTIDAPTDGITAELGTSGYLQTLALDGRACVDIAAAIGAEHPCADSDCDICRATEDGYPFHAARILKGATETPLLDAVVRLYTSAGMDFGAAADLDCADWLKTETWTKHAFKCGACNGVTFGDESWTPDQCASCGADEIAPVALDGYDVDGFMAGYLDAILFTESVGTMIEEDDFDDTSLLSHGCGRDNFTADAVRELKGDCVDFIVGNRKALDEYAEIRGPVVRCAPDSFGRSEYSAEECAGSDFWLSRNGHGAGFFDRGCEPVFAQLQDAARVYGEVSIYFDGDEITA